MQMCIVFVRSLRGFDTLKNFLKLASRVGSEADVRMICWSLLGVCRTKDGSSLIIVLRSEFIAWIGLNFVGAIGVGKNARSVRSNSRVTKFFLRMVGEHLEEHCVLAE